jgi:hypothetical protein
MVSAVAQPDRYAHLPEALAAPRTAYLVVQRPSVARAGVSLLFTFLLFSVQELIIVGRHHSQPLAGNCNAVPIPTPQPRLGSPSLNKEPEHVR